MTTASEPPALEASASLRRIAVRVGIVVAVTAMAFTLVSIASVSGQADVATIAVGSLVGVATSALLSAGWVMVLGVDRRPALRRWPVLAAAAVFGALVAGFGYSLVIGFFFVEARAAGWPLGLLIAVGEVASLALRMAGIGAGVWLAMRAIAGPRSVDNAVDDVDINAPALGRTIWLALGLHASAAFAMNALFVGQTLRFAPEAAFAVGEALRWGWSAMLLAVSLGVAFLARRTSQPAPGRWRWLLGFAVALAASGPLFLVSVRLAWRATRAIGLPAGALAPSITLVWALMALAASAAVLGLRGKRPAA